MLVVVVVVVAVMMMVTMMVQMSFLYKEKMALESWSW